MDRHISHHQLQDRIIIFLIQGIRVDDRKGVIPVYHSRREMRSDQRIKLAIAKRTIVFTLVVLFSNTLFAQMQRNGKVNIGLVYPLSSNWTGAPLDTNQFSLNLLAGVAAGENSFSFAGISNIIRHDAKGLQIAGFSNHIGKNANGVLIAGFMNSAKGGKHTAIAGFGNFAKTASHIQVTGMINIGGEVSSLQGAGFMNIARNVRGLQVSGFMNKAKHVKGVQIAGFINIADTADYQIGIINISKNGEMSIGAQIDENNTTLLTFRSGGKLVYGIIGAGYNFKNKGNVYAIEAGLGLHLYAAGLFHLDTELTQGTLSNFEGRASYRSTFRLMPAISMAKKISVFVSPSYNYISTDVQEDRLLRKRYLASWNRDNGRNFHGLYIGYTVGVIFSLR